MRNLLLGVTALVALPVLAHAQTQVPAISQSSPAADQRVAMRIPRGMPPPVQVMSPDRPLNLKERAAAALAEKWRNHPDKPIKGDDGSVEWVFGLSMPSIVCAPLHECDLALKPGEAVNSISRGDKTRWIFNSNISGFGSQRVQHVSIRPTDAGLSTNIVIYTTQRVYSIKLVSTRSQWTPFTSFIYPEDREQQWEQDRAVMLRSSGGAGGAPGGAKSAENLDFGFSIDGNAPWKPTAVYSDGVKTYIRFPSSMSFGSAPVLVGLANDAGWFSGPSGRTVNYRIKGNEYVVDSLLDHAELVAGVGSGQEKVEITRNR